MTEESRLEMRVGDRLPQFSAQALDEFGDPINVTGYRAWLQLAATDSDVAFGVPSPFVTECSITSPTLGTVRYDWPQHIVDAAHPSIINVSVRFVQIADPDISFEVPTRRDSYIVMRPTVDADGNYLHTDDGSALLLADDGQPMIAS